MLPAEQEPMSDTEKLQRRNRELLILNAIAEALNREVDLTEALHTALARVTELFNLQTGWVWLQHEDTGKPYLAAAQNLPPALACEPSRFDGTCYCLDTYQLGDLDGATNISMITCTRLKELIGGTAGLRYHASIPLYHHDKKVGVLNVARTDWQELSADDLRLLSTVGDLLSISIERAQLFEKSVQFGAAEERNRLAREIHDTLAQGLTAIALQLETADALLDADTGRAKQAIRQALSLTRANLDEARRSVMDLRAAPLEGQSLPDALTRLVNDYAAKWPIEAHFRSIGANQPLPVNLEVGLYRIAQEALTNVVRHANAEHVTVELTIVPEKVELLVEDDGQGFDTLRLPEGRFGLIGLNERAKLLGGSLELSSSPGDGTSLNVVIPLKAEL
jgi:two-component system, NarL family, sensor kinase